MKDIGSEGIQVSWNLAPPFLRACLLETIANPAKASGNVTMSLTRNGARVYAHGAVHAQVEIACGRCLDVAPVAIDSTVQVTYVPASLVPQPAEHEIHGDDPDYCTYSGDEIDFGDLVREQVLLGIPYAPLCREDCQGLCPRCGTDRNHTACACPPLEDGKVAARLPL